MDRPGAPVSLTRQQKAVDVTQGVPEVFDVYSENLVECFDGYYPARWDDMLPVPNIQKGKAMLGKVDQRELVSALETVSNEDATCRLLGYPMFADPKTISDRFNVAVPNGVILQVLVASSVSRGRIKVVYTPILSIPSNENGPDLFVMLAMIAIKGKSPIFFLVPPSRIQDITCCDQAKRIEKMPAYSATRVHDITAPLINPAKHVLASALLTSSLACEGKYVGGVVAAILDKQAPREVLADREIPKDKLKEMAIDVDENPNEVTNWIEETIDISVRKRQADAAAPVQRSPKRTRESMSPVLQVPPEDVIELPMDVSPQTPNESTRAEPTQAPIQPDSAPSEPTQAPIQPDSASTESTAASTEPTEASTESTAAPTEPTAAPTEPASAPNEPAATPTEQASAERALSEREPTRPTFKPVSVMFDVATIPQSEIDPAAWRASIQMLRKERRAKFPPAFPEHMTMVDLPYGAYMEAILRMCQLSIMTITSIKTMLDGIPEDAAERCMHEIGSSTKILREFIDAEIAWEREISADMRMKNIKASRI